MVKVEKKNGIVRVSGCGKGEWLLLPFWPCSGATVRLSARPGLPQEWIDEVVAFAEAENESA